MTDLAGRMKRKASMAAWKSVTLKAFNKKKPKEKTKAEELAFNSHANCPNLIRGKDVNLTDKTTDTYKHKHAHQWMWSMLIESTNYFFCKRSTGKTVEIHLDMLTFGYCLVGISTRSLSLRFLVANRSKYVSFSGSFLVSPFWILSISGGGGREPKGGTSNS